MPVTCRHEGVELLAVTVHNRELLAILCPGCGDIKLVDLATWETNTCFSSTQYRPDYMCHEDSGSLYVNSLRDSYPIMKLDCSKLNFTGSNEILYSGVERWCSGMCYMPAPFRALVLCVASESLINVMFHI